MRTLDEVTPTPATAEAILRHGLRELAAVAPGIHQENEGRYAAMRGVRDYAQSILAAAEAVDGPRSCDFDHPHPDHPCGRA